MTENFLRELLPEEPLQKPPSLPFFHTCSGKVRELYDTDAGYLILSTDRISAFDVILPSGIPGKGILLNQVSLWWFSQMEPIVNHHLVEDHQQKLEQLLGDHPHLIPRCMLVRKLKPLPLEAIVRGYLAGSAWKEYEKTGRVQDHSLPPGMQPNEQFPQPLFTPSTKCAHGHDELISEAQAQKRMGSESFEKVKEFSLRVYTRASEIARLGGLILADSKFEYGEDAEGNLFIIDELLTPDSSRYWPADDYAIGATLHAFDKQYVRDYLQQIDWNKSDPAPVLPTEVVEQTRERYLSAILKCTSYETTEETPPSTIG